MPRRFAGSSMKDRFRSTELKLCRFFLFAGRSSAPTGGFARSVTRTSPDAPLPPERRLDCLKPLPRHHGLGHRWCVILRHPTQVLDEHPASVDEADLSS